MQTTHRTRPATLDVGARVRVEPRATLEELGAHELLGPLGGGAMGRVYLARLRATGQLIALKRARGSTSAQRRWPARARMLREAHALARLDHPAIPRLVGAALRDGLVTIAMEYVPGLTLDRWLATARGPDVWRRLAAALVQAARALAAVHDAGLIHRDVKPANVLVDRRGRAALIDFGLARSPRAHADDEPREGPRDAFLSLSITQLGAVVGTPRFCAPEQLRGEACDGRSDQFSFCAAMAALLYARDPFDGDRIDARLRSIAASRPALVGPRLAFPTALRSLIARGLAAEPDRRHASMRVIADAIEACAQRPTLA
ncbi:MAG: serine/threonine protein kinase [Myxococcales bacterium]|nr:serine/threonine protein kinase [Myxococcales bacterium]